jgi:hypothetical protein
MQISLRLLNAANYWSVTTILAIASASLSPAPLRFEAPSAPRDAAPVTDTDPSVLPRLNPDRSAASQEWSGQVAHYLLTLDGIVEGLILTNGLQLRFPPHMSALLVAAVQPGDSIRVEGEAGKVTDFGQAVRAARIVNLQTGEMVVEQPPGSTGLQVLTTTDYAQFDVSGTAAYWLVGHQGEIRGIVLSSGAQVRFSPEVSDQLYAIAQTGVRVEATGFGSGNGFGPVIEATSLVVNGQPISLNAPRPYPG